MGDDEYSYRVGIINQKACRQISQITESLFAGSEYNAQERDVLLNLKITHIVNCCGKIVPNFFEDTFVYKKLELNDTGDEDVLNLFNEVVSFIDSAIASGGKVFVHCQRGVSRAPTFVLSYIMWHQHLTYEQAYRVVKVARNCCCPNPGFAFQLVEWENVCCPERQPDSALKRITDSRPHGSHVHEQVEEVKT